MTSIPHITPIYAGLLGLMLVALSWRVMRMRAKLDVAMGDGGERALNVAVRIQGNFIEYVPMALILLYFCEILGWSPLALHGLGTALVAARLAHVHGMLQKNAAGKGRRWGARLTFAVIIAASLLCLLALAGWVKA
jgi:uncharacterized membrane protein YecN with MAPEG domain